MPAVQEYAKNTIVDELKSKLNTEVGIGNLHFQLFNTIKLDSVYLYGQQNEKILVANSVYANIDLLDLLKGKVVINSASLTDFEVHLSKETSDSPLNIQYVIDAFKPKDDSSSPKVDVKLSSIHISGGQFFFDIKDKPIKEKYFDANHIEVKDLNAKLSLKSLTADSLNIQVKKLSLKEKSGLEISNLVLRVLTQGKNIAVKGFRLDMPSSYLELDKCQIDLTQATNKTDILENAVLYCAIAPSFISPKDISALVPALEHFSDLITLQGNIAGTIDEIKTDISINYGEEMKIVASAELLDIRHSDKAYILGSVDNLTITKNGLERLINNFSKNKSTLPKQIANLGTISFQGDVSGYLKQLTAFGSFETQRGIIKTDILFGLNPSPSVESYIHGKVYTSGFDLGGMLDDTNFDKTSFTLDIDIQNGKYGNKKGYAKGNILDFGYKGYVYNNVTLDVNLNDHIIDGRLDAETPNGALNINGSVDLSDKKQADVNFTVRADNIELDDLQLAKSMKNTNFSFVMHANMKGKGIDDMQGSISIDSIDFIREDKRFMMDNFLIEALGAPSDRSIKITSDLIHANISGAYSVSSIVNSVKRTLNPYLPALIKAAPENTSNTESENNLTFDIQINNTESLSSILNLPVTVISPAKIIGFYNNVQDKFKVEVFTPSLKAGGTNINSGYVLADNLNNVISTKIDALLVGKKATNSISINAKASNNIVDTNIAFSNDGKQKAKGEFAISTSFSKEDNNLLKIDVSTLPSELTLNNSTWKMDRSHILVEGKKISVNNFHVHNDTGDQEIKINGSFSPNSSEDILQTDLKNINLEYIFETLAIEVLKFGGEATGSLYLSSVEDKPYANTNLDIANFKFNGTELGKLSLYSELDKNENKVILAGKITNKENKITGVEGFIDPVKQELSINFDADSLDVGFLHQFTKTIFNKLSGRGTGHVRLFGNFSKVTVEGQAFINNGEVGISFLNTDYTFSDTVYMKPNLIYFNNITFTDAHNNKAISSGKVSHNLFTNFMYHVDFEASNFLVYNATEKINPLFFGKVFGSGKASVGGDEKAVDIDVNMRTEKNSIVRMNFMEDVVSEYNFITYKDKDKTDTISTDLPKKGIAPIKSSTGMDVNMNFYIDATPDAVVELVMDPVGGDVLRGSGSGGMRFEWNSKLPPRLYGTYNINLGSYNFTFQRLVERKFAIQDGSSVQFQGDPFEATLDIEAIYKVSANLNDLDKNIVTNSGQTTVPVNCILDISGPLKFPKIKLDLKLPTVDAEIERQVKSFLNTEDMINRQVTYLLLLSKFYTPEYAETENKSNDFAALASATLSNQLTKIISQIDDRWQLGTNIRTTEFTSQSSTEVELLLSSRLLNDRLLINGNFGYRDNPLSNATNASSTKNTFVGDIDIEYLLNNSGTWRVKVYNHFNEKFYYTKENATQTQGVGIMYKKDFDNIRDLIWIPKIDLPRKDSITPILPDSVKKGSSLSSFIKIK